MIKLIGQQVGNICGELENILSEQLLKSRYFMDIVELPGDQIRIVIHNIQERMGRRLQIC